MRILGAIVTLAVGVVLVAGIALLFGAALTAVFNVAGWHLPWSVITF